MGNETDEGDGLAGWRRYRSGVKPLRRKASNKASVKPAASLVSSSSAKPGPSMIAEGPTGAGKKIWRRLAAAATPARAGGASHWQEVDRNLAVDDPQWRRRLQEGEVRPEARLDLHHHAAAAAHQAVVAFIAQAQRRDQRILLIITGMGEILRPSLPCWLAEPPLKASIRWVFPAAPSHGGQGAFYVVLRRRKSNDK